MIEMQDLKEWDQYMNSEIPIVIQAGASWCGPSQMLQPMLQEQGQQFKGKVQYVYMDIDKFHEIGELLEISYIPQTFTFNKGNLVD